MKRVIVFEQPFGVIVMYGAGHRPLPEAGDFSGGEIDACYLNAVAVEPLCASHRKLFLYRGSVGEFPLSVAAWVFAKSHRKLDPFFVS